ncbi:hypothetical protein ACFQ9X_06230 [Catenulispora yoronensis]
MGRAAVGRLKAAARPVSITASRPREPITSALHLAWVLLTKSGLWQVAVFWIRCRTTSSSPDWIGFHS